MSKPADQTMGNMIASLRKERGMTQAELAQKMNVTDKAVSKWERDISCPDVASLPRLAGIFGISVDDLLCAKVPAENTAEKETSDSVVDLIFKAVTLAMGIAVVVLSALKKIDAGSGFGLLGIGLSCAGISLLRKGR